MDLECTMIVDSGMFYIVENWQLLFILYLEYTDLKTADPVDANLVNINYGIFMT